MNKLRILFFLTITPFWAFSQKQVIDKVVATVGGEIILLSEVEEQFAYAKEKDAKLPDEFRCISLQNLIVQKLLVNQAKLDSIEVRDEEVESQLNLRIDRLLSYFNQDPKGVEEFYGQTIDQLKDQTRNELRNQLLADRMQGKITEKATITPSEVQDFFNNIPKDSLPYFNAEVEIREIVLKPQVNAAKREQARLTAEDIRQRIEAGKETFEELAKKFSDDPGSGSQGGDLGWQKRGTFVPTFEAMAYKLEKDQISPITETEFGFHIIQLLERRGNLIHARHILVKPELTDEDFDLAKAKLDSIRTQITDKKITFSEAVKKYGDKNQQSHSNDGRVTNPRSGTTYFEVADLETNVYFAIEGLQVGEIAKPFDFKGPDGNVYYRIVQLTNKSRPHKADLKQDYGKIQSAALEQKKGDYTEKWVLSRLKSTYLSINPKFGGCENLNELLEAGNQQ